MKYVDQDGNGVADMNVLQSDLICSDNSEETEEKETYREIFDVMILTTQANLIEMN